MFFLRFLQFLLGYVQFSIEGGSPEKFLSLSAREGIALWNIRRKETLVYANILERSYQKALTLSRRCGVTLRLVKRRGMPVHLKKYKRRQGLLAGILLFIGIIWFFSSFIWTVQITGNQSVSTGQIEEVLDELGVRPGAFPMLLNVKSVEQQALLKLPDLSGIAINIQGSTAVVHVHERTLPPDVVPQSQPCNVKAAFTGQILTIEAYEGKAMVRKGDTVEQGGLLVSGVVEDKNGVTTFLHASGKAVARTQRTFSVTVPFVQKQVQDTGEVVRKDTLRLFGLTVPLYFTTPSGRYRQTAEEYPLRVFSMTLPFSVTQHLYHEQKQTVQTLTQAQAAEKAKSGLADKIKTELSSAKILGMTFESNHDKNGYTLTGHYTCEENIAYQEAIEIS